MCRQLGIRLHELGRTLPLYDGVTGLPVPADVDARVERVRDTLMDDARERVDREGEAATMGESLGAALSRAFTARFSGQGKAAVPAEAGAEPALTAEWPSDGLPASEAAESRDGAAVELGTDELGVLPPPSSGAVAQDEPGDAFSERALASGKTDATLEEPVKQVASEGAAESDLQVWQDSAAAVAEQRPGSTDASRVGENPSAEAVPQPVAAEREPANPPTGASEEGKEEDPEEEPLPSSLDEAEQRLLDWHWSNLEYGCSARLNEVRISSCISALEACRSCPVMLWS
jgi:hypothetical protein